MLGTLSDTNVIAAGAASVALVASLAGSPVSGAVASFGGAGLVGSDFLQPTHTMAGTSTANSNRYFFINILLENMNSKQTSETDAEF
jgi:hypothetical protein